MTSLFRGRFDCKTDSKGRLNLPAPYRQDLVGGETSLIITNSLYKKQRCLDVYTLAEWEKLEARISNLAALRSEVQAYQRFYLSSGQLVTLDTQNRILIPANMRKYADLSEQVMLVGMGNKFEIWNEIVWQGLYGDLTDNFEDILSAVAQLESEL